MDNFRKTDFVFRYGGEEFVVILTETNLESSKIPLERLRAKIAEYPFVFNGQPLHITVSTGVSSNNAETIEEFLDNADKALYRAKQTGRNKVEIFQ